MQNVIEQREEKSVTSQYWGFRELTAEELMLIGGGESEDGDEAPEQETPLPDVTAYASDSNAGGYGDSGMGGFCPAPPPPKPEHDSCLDGIMGGAIGGVAALTAGPVLGPALAIAAIVGGAVGSGCFGKDTPGTFRK